jgi:hypothetical protein
MQKVEGSSPFIRFTETPWKRGLSCLSSYRIAAFSELRRSALSVEVDELESSDTQRRCSVMIALR